MAVESSDSLSGFILRLFLIESDSYVSQWDESLLEIEELIEEEIESKGIEDTSLDAEA